MLEDVDPQFARPFPQNVPLEEQSRSIAVNHPKEASDEGNDTFEKPPEATAANKKELPINFVTVKEVDKKMEDTLRKVTEEDTTTTIDEGTDNGETTAVTDHITPSQPAKASRQMLRASEMSPFSR